MITAIILIADDGAKAAPCFAVRDGGTVLESVVRAVLRGPFGGTLVAVSTSLAAEAQRLLTGFAVQVISADSDQLIAAALKAEQALRARWQKAMLAAHGRFAGQSSPSGAAACGVPETMPPQLRRSKDVKVRALAHSFERDGVMLLRGDDSGVTPELLAALVEAFARGDKTGAGVQAERNGKPDYPVLLDAAVNSELAALNDLARLDEWLVSQRKKHTVVGNWPG